MSEEAGCTASGQQQETLWIKAVLADDRTAFDRLVLRYKDRIFNLCYRLLGDHEEACDHAQEVFVKAFRSLKHFRFDSSFSTWLHAIAVNTCRNRLQSAEYRSRRKKVSIDEMAEAQGGCCTLEDPSPSVLDRMVQRETEVLLQRAIDALPEESRIVVVLRDIEGFSYEEISAVTGLNSGTVKSRLSRARQQIRDQLKGVI